MIPAKHSSRPDTKYILHGQQVWKEEYVLASLVLFRPEQKP